MEASTFLTDKHKKTIKRIFNIISIIIIVMVAVMLETKISSIIYKKESETASYRCPSLFSITRSARDTLIVMRVEPVCRTYVLENLK
jgi:hypothetical protein